MHVGGKRRMFIPPQLAYGNKGSERAPNSMLIFDVDFIAQSDADPLQAGSARSLPGAEPRCSTNHTDRPAQPATPQPLRPRRPARNRARRSGSETAVEESRAARGIELSNHRSPPWREKSSAC